MDLSKLSTDELLALRNQQLSAEQGYPTPTMRRNPGLQDLPVEKLLEMRRMLDPTTYGSDAENLAAGFGKAFIDKGRGLGQFAGIFPQSKIDEWAKLDRPLMENGPGQLGNVLGNASLAAPTAVIPGANTALGAGAIGGAMGFMEPVPTGGSRMGNTTRGAMFSAAVPAAVAFGKTIRAATDPLYAKGQDRIVANTLNRFATDPNAAKQALANPQEFVPGSKPTVAEATLDPGLATLQRGAFSADPQIAGAFSQREAQNQGARISALKGVAGDQQAMDAAIAARRAATDPLYAAAGKVTVQPDEALQKILAKPSVKDAMSVAERLAAENGDALAVNPETGEMAGSTLHYIKMALDDMADPSVASGIGKHQQKAINGTRSQLLEWMDKNIPAYGKARRAFAEKSKPINQMEVGQYLSDKLNPALSDFGQIPRVRAEAYANALRNAEQTTRNATGFQSNALEKVMTPEQMGTLTGIGKDLARRAAAQEAGKALGSPTAQNLSSQNLMSQLAGPLGMPDSWADSALLGTLARPMDWAMKKADPIVQRKLAEALLDPAVAYALLGRVAVPPNALLAGASRYLPAMSGAGLLAYSAQK